MLLLFLPLSSCNCLWNLSFPHRYLYGFAFFLSTVWSIGDEIFQSGYRSDCGPWNRGLLHFYATAPKDLWVGMHPAELSLLLSMPRLSVQQMHTKSLCPTLPRNTGCVIQLGTLQHMCSKCSNTQKHRTYCTGATCSSSVPVQDAWNTSQLDGCCCILAKKHLGNTAGSG